MTPLDKTYVNMQAGLWFYIELSGRTAASIAEETGISRSALSLILSGRRKPSLPLFFRLCAVLKQNPAHLMFPFTDPRNNHPFTRN